MTFSPSTTSTSSRGPASFAGSEAIAEVRGDSIDDSIQLLVRHAGEDGKREGFSREPLRHWKCTLCVAEPFVCSGQMHGLGIVPAAGDAPRAQVCPERVGICRSDDVEMPHGIAPGEDLGKYQVADVR